jgi:hypothetical protein
MTLQAQPDFQQSLNTDAAQILYPYGLSQRYYALPDRLEIAQRADGRPDFRLDFARGENPMLPPAPYVVLDFSARPHIEAETALTAVRERYPQAVLEPVGFTSGVLRLQIVDSNGQTTTSEPAPLVWNPIGDARFVQKLTPEQGSVIERALRGELLTVQCYADLEMMGVSPRLPLSVTFNPLALTDQILAGIPSQNRQLAWADAVEWVTKNYKTLQFTLSSSLIDGQERDFAEALIDRIRLQYGAFTPAPLSSFQYSFNLGTIPSATVTWNLAEPLLVPRTSTLLLHPITSAREVVEKHGIEAVRSETIVPAIPMGFQAVEIVHYLPPDIEGLLAMDVTLYAEPKLPFRPQPIARTLELKPEQKFLNTVLRFSPAEEPEYTATTSVVVRDGTGIQQVRGEPVQHSGGSVELNASHFPVDFIPVGASRALLELARITITCVRSTPGGEVRQSFELNAQKSSTAVALPKEAENVTFDLQLQSLDGGKTLALNALPARPLYLSLTSFPEYGAHTVDVECLLDGSMELFAVDLLPENQPETPEAIKLLFFTPDQPKKSWSWYANSPLYPGYRWRVHATGDDTTNPWITVNSPFEPLQIDARLYIRKTAMPTAPFEMNGIDIFPDPDDTYTFRYLAGEPSPEIAPDGQPTLILWASDQGGMLQLGTHWGLDEATQAELLVRLADRYPQLKRDAIRLVPVSVMVKDVTLAIGDGSSQFTPLESKASSGYPPFATIFNLQLSAEQKVNAQSALNERPDFLRVTYHVDVSMPVTVETRLAGDLTQAIRSAGSIASITDSLQLIETALSSGALQITRSGAADAPANLRQRVDQLAKHKAAELLLSLVRGTIREPDTAHFEALAVLTEQASFPIERSTDVASWFSQGSGADHIRVLGVSLPDQAPTDPSGPGQTPAKVALGFQAVDLPVAFIRAGEGTLRSPGFEPITISPSTANQPLDVETHYTTGAPPFKTTLSAPANGDWQLLPEHLGLLKVVVDGQAVQQKGDQRARVRVQYRNQEGGIGDDRLIYLRDDHWIESWYVITSGETGGSFAYEWSETKADGSLVQHDRVTSSSPELTLETTQS